MDDLRLHRRHARGERERGKERATRTLLMMSNWELQSEYPMIAAANLSELREIHGMPGQHVRRDVLDDRGGLRRGRRGKAKKREEEVQDGGGQEKKKKVKAIVCHRTHLGGASPAVPAALPLDPFSAADVMVGRGTETPDPQFARHRSLRTLRSLFLFAPSSISVVAGGGARRCVCVPRKEGPPGAFFFFFSFLCSAWKEQAVCGQKGTLPFSLVVHRIVLLFEPSTASSVECWVYESGNYFYEVFIFFFSCMLAGLQAAAQCCSSA